MCIDNTLVQYAQELYYSTCSKSKIEKIQINDAKKINDPSSNCEDYIGMSDCSAVVYEPKREICIYISLEKNLKECLSRIDEIKTFDENNLFSDVKKYWRQYLEKHFNYYVGNNKLSNKETDIIERTILMYALLSNKETGAVLASPDVDEEFSKCGRYGYCWPRDALFINNAMLLLGMNDMVNKFYSVWAEKTQLPNGLFEQRYYSDGNLAPSWGIQIDETASMIIGIDALPNKKDYAPIVQKATEGIISFLDDNYVSRPCYDIWEERKDVHLYSNASIYKGLECARNVLQDDDKYNHVIYEIDMIQPKILEAIKSQFVEDDYLKRSKYNSITDISVLGSVIPFGVFNEKDTVVLNSVNKIENELKTSCGGYLRYKDDEYIGGNAWIISSLWLALYYLEVGNRDKAKELYDWVTNHSDSNGFLAEQIDKDTGKPAWIVGLSWSHALYVIVGKKLRD